MARRKDTAKKTRGRTVARRSGGAPSLDRRVDSQRVLTTLMSNLPGMVYRCGNDRDWTKEFVSDGCLLLTGYRADELVGKGAVSYGRQIIHPDDRQPVWDQVQEALAGRQPFRLSYRIVTKSGTEKWVWEQGRGIFDPHGTLLALEGFITDMTERKRAESDLQSTHRLFQLLAEFNAFASGQQVGDLVRVTLNFIGERLGFQHSTIALFLPERQGFQIVEARHRDTTGFDRGAFVPMQETVLSEVIRGSRPLYRPDLAAEAERYAINRKLLDAGLRSDFLVPLWNEGTCLGTLNVASSHRDGFTEADRDCLTLMAPRLAQAIDQAMLVQRLQESEGRLQEAVRASEAGIFDHDHLADTNYWSPRQRTIFGVGPDEVVTLRLFLDALYPEDLDRIQAAVLRAHEPSGDGRFDVEYRVIRRDGAVRWLSTQSQTFFESRDGARRPVRTVGATIDVTARKQAEQALQESSQFNRQVITNAREGIIVYDRDLRYVVWNRCMEELTGLKAGTVLGKRPTDLPAIYEAEHGRLVMDQETMARIEASILRAMTGETFSFLDVSFVVRQTGVKGWTSVRYGPFHNAQGEIIGVIATVWEITERKRTEEQLEQSVSLLQATLESTANGLVVIDAQGKIVSYNQRFLDMWRMPESHVKSRDERSFLEDATPQLKNPEVLPVKMKELSTRPEAESVDFLEFQDGRVFECHSNPHRIGERIIGRVWSFHDITTLKLVEQSLTKLSSAVEQSAESVFITDRDGVIEYVNPAFEEMVGYSREEAIGQNARLLKSGHHSGRFYESLWETILSGRAFRAIFVNKKKNGDIYYEDKTITPIKSQDGTITHFVSVGRDITERRRSAEARERLAAILEATTDFVGTVDVNGSFLYLNQAGRTMLGLGAKEPAAGLQISACHPQWAAAVILNEAIPKAIKQGVWSGESVLLSRDGREIPVSQVILAHKSADGSVEYLSTIARDISERKAQTAALEYQANHDGLTALPNRNLLNDRLRQAILAAQRDHHSLALLVLDLDRFKEINDTLGHHHGDLLLKEVGPRLRAALRESDTIARLGGDEFAVLLPTADQEGAVMTAQKILQTLTTPFMLDELALDVEASIGIELFSERALDAETILRHADVAMYMAKQAGSGYALYDSEHDQYSHRRLSLMGELRHAIERKQLFMHYQPTVGLKQGQVIGVESLLRWRHPKYGLVPTDQFIPLAEQTGLIKPLTELVVGTALEQCRVWLREGMPLSVSVNLSARSLHDPTFADQIDKRLLEYGIAPRLLEMEITESAIMSDPDRAMEILSSLSIMGVRLAIDDFGVGHSSLAYLKKLPVHEIKIDKSFVMNMDEDPDDVMIVRSIIDLGHNQGLKVVAEGVQSQQTLDKLIELGCDAVQGYFVSRPIPAEELTRWVSTSPWTIAKV